jgi:hypothetical protein
MNVEEQSKEATVTNLSLRNNLTTLYFIVRLLAIFVFGPLLIYKGIVYTDQLLVVLGVLLILWDGMKVTLQTLNFP